jgi:hypothetical protein
MQRINRPVRNARRGRSSDDEKILTNADDSEMHAAGRRRSFDWRVDLSAPGEVCGVESGDVQMGERMLGFHALHVFHRLKWAL